MYIIQNNQVLIVEEIDTGTQVATITRHFDFVFRGEIQKETETEKIYKVMKFDIDVQGYIVTIESGENCFIDGEFYNFENGTVVINKDK